MSCFLSIWSFLGNSAYIFSCVRDFFVNEPDLSSKKSWDMNQRWYCDTISGTYIASSSKPSHLLQQICGSSMMLFTQSWSYSFCTEWKEFLYPPPRLCSFSLILNSILTFECIDSACRRICVRNHRTYSLHVQGFSSNYLGAHGGSFHLHLLCISQVPNMS